MELMEPLWKTLEIIIDKRLNAIDFHKCLHGFVARQGTWTLIIKRKLVQQLVLRNQMPLYGVFIDLQKVFDAMDC